MKLAAQVWSVIAAVLLTVSIILGIAYKLPAWKVALMAFSVIWAFTFALYFWERVYDDKKLASNNAPAAK